MQSTYRMIMLTIIALAMLFLMPTHSAAEDYALPELARCNWHHGKPPCVEGTFCLHFLVAMQFMINKNLPNARCYRLCHELDCDDGFLCEEIRVYTFDKTSRSVNLCLPAMSSLDFPPL